MGEGVGMYEPRLAHEALYSLGLTLDYELKDLADDGLMIMADDRTLTGLAEILTLELFEDMTLSDGWIAEFADVSQRAETCELYEPITVRAVNEGKGYAGAFSPDTGEIEVDTGSRITVPTIAHELIHLWEYRLRKFDYGYSDLMLIHYWEEFKPEIPNLREVAGSLMVSESHNEISESGGQHGLLFMLKSYDIDRRMGWPFGKTFGYGGAVAVQGDSGCDYADR